MFSKVGCLSLGAFEWIREQGFQKNGIVYASDAVVGLVPALPICHADRPSKKTGQPLRILRSPDSYAGERIKKRTWR